MPIHFLRLGFSILSSRKIAWTTWTGLGGPICDRSTANKFGALSSPSPASKRLDSQLISRSFALLIHLFKVAGLERLMWTRAAVALRNINICEMPSHDDYLGAGRGAGCGARVPCGCVPVTVRACWAGAPWAGKRGSCVPQVCVLPRGTWVPGLDDPGRVQWASRVRFCVPPYTWNCTHVALCLACYPKWGCRLHV